MFVSHDTYHLALGVLKGEKDSHQILADLFEEQGDRASAAFARSDKKKPRKRFDLVLGIMPVCTSVRLSCDFVEHITSDAFRVDNGLGAREMDTVREWCDEEKTSDVLRQICDPVWSPTQTIEISNDMENVYRLRQRMIDCVNLAVKFVDKHSHGSSRMVRSVGVNENTKNIANLARKIASATISGWHDNYRWSQEFNWQFQRTQSVLEALTKH